jgi:hypothetical protein
MELFGQLKGVALIGNVSNLLHEIRKRRSIAKIFLE